MFDFSTSDHQPLSMGERDFFTHLASYYKCLMSVHIRRPRPSFFKSTSASYECEKRPNANVTELFIGLTIQTLTNVGTNVN